MKPALVRGCKDRRWRGQRGARTGNGGSPGPDQSARLLPPCGQGALNQLVSTRAASRPAGRVGSRDPWLSPAGGSGGFWLRGLRAARSTLLFNGPGRPAAHSPSRTPRPRAVTLPTTAAASVVFQQQALAPLRWVPSTALSWSMPSEQTASGVKGRRRRRRSLGWTVTCQLRSPRSPNQRVATRRERTDGHCAPCVRSGCTQEVSPTHPGCRT